MRKMEVLALALALVLLVVMARMTTTRMQGAQVINERVVNDRISEPRFYQLATPERELAPTPQGIDYGNLRRTPGYPYWLLPRSLEDPGAKRVPIPHGPKGSKPAPVPCTTCGG